MRRLKVVLREEAIADLADIYHHIARVSGSHVAAIGFVRRIKARCQRIGNVPMPAMTCIPACAPFLSSIRPSLPMWSRTIR
jgi:plasmid stabilization system protein ParE